MLRGNPNRARIACAAAGLAIFLSMAARADDDALPQTLVPFEPLVGGWKGTGQPVANRIKGWQERHVWSWKFSKGKPVAVTLSWEGNKLITAGTITADPTSGGYKLEGVDGDGKAIAYAGKFDDSGRNLVLKPTSEVAGDPQLTVRINENGIRYTVWIDRKENGAPRARREIEVGVTKDGEAFAAGSTSGASGPKCVVTGGAATFSVTFEGKTYPLCCTGCRDEFNDNPQKYVAKVAAMVKAGNAPSPAPASPRAPAPEKAEKAEAKKAPAMPAVPEKASSASKAASWLRLGQALERSGKKSSALEYYKRILAETPDAPEAKVAAEKVKALEGK